MENLFSVDEIFKSSNIKQLLSIITIIIIIIIITTAIIVIIIINIIIITIIIKTLFEIRKFIYLCKKLTVYFILSFLKIQTATTTNEGTITATTAK